MVYTAQNKAFYNFTGAKWFWKVGGERKKRTWGTIVLELSNTSLCDLLVYFESSPTLPLWSITHQPNPSKSKGRGWRYVYIAWSQLTHTQTCNPPHLIILMPFIYDLGTPSYLWGFGTKLKTYFLSHLASAITYLPKGPKSPKPQGPYPFLLLVTYFLNYFFLTPMRICLYSFSVSLACPTLVSLLINSLLLQLCFLPC